MSDPKTMNQLRNLKLSPERRSEIARQAAKARWEKARAVKGYESTRFETTQQISGMPTWMEPGNEEHMRQWNEGERGME